MADFPRCKHNKITNNQYESGIKWIVILHLENLMKKTITDNIYISVQPKYLPEKSNPSKPIYFFSYHIKIVNQGSNTVQLKSRYWHITDGNGNIEEIRGPGVVGNQPHLKQAERFEYTSYCPLSTEFGVMYGHFEMICETGKKFNANIQPFRLTIPHSVN